MVSILLRWKRDLSRKQPKVLRTQCGIWWHYELRADSVDSIIAIGDTVRNGLPILLRDQILARLELETVRKSRPVHHN